MLGEALASPLADYYLIVGAAMLLIGFGITMVLSSSSAYAQFVVEVSPYYFVIRQLVFLMAGAAGAWVISRLKLETLRNLSVVMVIIAMGLLLATFTPLGASENGNQNWLKLPFQMRIQPSEFAKIAMVVWGSNILAKKEKLLDRPKELLIPFLPVCMLLIAMVLLEQDLGTAMIMLGILGAILWVVGTSWKVLAGLVAAALLGVACFVLTSANRMERLVSFIDPGAAKAGKNDQAISAMYALASGGWWGRGLGASRQKWGALPEAHTDFIFAVLGEELGLVGALLVVVLFLILGLAGLRVSQRSQNAFARFCSAGITLWFLMQATINILVVLRWLPVLGVPLPFLSYGGSALLASLLALGVLMACARNEPEAAAVLARNRLSPRPKLTTIVDGRQ